MLSADASFTVRETSQLVRTSMLGRVARNITPLSRSIAAARTASVRGVASAAPVPITELTEDEQMCVRSSVPRARAWCPRPCAARRMRDTVARFANDVVAPKVKEMDAEGKVRSRGRAGPRRRAGRAACP